MKHRSETFAVGVFYHGCLAVIKDSDIQNQERRVESRAELIRAKKMPDRRVKSEVYVL
jgi:hypothetical protein